MQALHHMLNMDHHNRGMHFQDQYSSNDPEAPVFGPHGEYAYSYSDWNAHAQPNSSIDYDAAAFTSYPGSFSSSSSRPSTDYSYDGSYPSHRDGYPPLETSPYLNALNTVRLAHEFKARQQAGFISTSQVFGSPPISPASPRATPVAMPIQTNFPYSTNGTLPHQRLSISPTELHASPVDSVAPARVPAHRHATISLSSPGSKRRYSDLLGALPDSGEEERSESETSSISGSSGGSVYAPKSAGRLSTGPSTSSSSRRPAAIPEPVPNLTKKSRGRQVPTGPVFINHGGVEKNVRTYKCEVENCGKCFARGEHLKRHVRSIHTNEKPYSCNHPGCDKEFSRFDNLAQHKRVHTSRRR